MITICYFQKEFYYYNTLFLFRKTNEIGLLFFL